MRVMEICLVGKLLLRMNVANYPIASGMESESESEREKERGRER